MRIFGLKRKKIKSLGIGIFDGIHLGHQSILNSADALLTFYPHPDVFLGKKTNLKMLTTLREQRFYVPYLLALHFNEAVAAMPAKAFLDYFIFKLIQPQKLIVGEDFHFGSGRDGNVAFLLDWAKKHAMTVQVMPLVRVEERIVSSTAIRQLIQSDSWPDAVQWLGHPYLMIGKVIEGDGRGRNMGFPTANLKLPKGKLVPNSGVYYGFVRLPELRPALIYIGTKPTFASKGLSCEVHIMGFDGALYGRQIKVFIQGKLRTEIRFESIADLITQMQLDLKQALAFHASIEQVK